MPGSSLTFTTLKHEETQPLFSSMEPLRGIGLRGTVRERLALSPQTLRETTPRLQSATEGKFPAQRNLTLLEIGPACIVGGAAKHRQAEQRFSLRQTTNPPTKRPSPGTDMPTTTQSCRHSRYDGPATAVVPNSKSPRSYLTTLLSRARSG